jgi:AraC-like DNA-binding protein/mannose-6-phosphate isomerase-like protein (cupin superfamily)
MLRKADFFAYLTAKPHEDWGIELTTVGHQHVAPRSKYPPSGHPITHAFEWKHGRELNEHHLVYVPSGAGYFETRRKAVEVAAGDLLLIHKSDWHRYRPHDETGWEAYWMGFKGRDIEKYVGGKVFALRKSTLQTLGYRPGLMQLFDQLIDLSRRDTPLFKTVSLGCVLQILAYAAVPTEATVPARKKVAVVDTAIVFIRRNLFAKVDFHELAGSLGISYSRFRSLFKNATGIAPHQFLLNERIACAKRLLKNPVIEIKTVGYKAGFRSASYFCKIFRRKTGITPSAERSRRY